MGVGVKGDLKAARVRMQAGEPAEALSIIQRILADSSPDLKDAQTLYTVLVMQGMAGLAVDDLATAESSFRRATETMPDAPQAWKGLIDCLERAGASRSDALPECLARAAEIAEGKGNFSRARTLRLRLGTVLDTLGRQEEALETVLRHLDNPDALASGVDAGSTPAIERLSLLLLAAVLEVDKEEAAVSSRVEKRLAKDRGISSTAAAASAAERHRASALTFEYRTKALGKDAAFEEGSVGTGPVGRRLSDALQALVREAEGARGGEGDGSSISSSNSSAGGLMAQQHNGAWKALVARFCRVYLQRAVHIAEAAPSSSSSWKWQKVLAASAAVETAVGCSRWDEGWAATTKFVVSAYSSLITRHTPNPKHQEGAGNARTYTATAEELKRMATEGSEQEADAGPAASACPWLKAEASLHLAVLALWAGDATKADALLTAASAGGVTKLLSGPGSCWRELALRCLVDERLGGDGAGGGPGVGGGDAAMTAAGGLARVDAAIAAFDESFRLRGAPASEGSYADVLGSLGLARASLLLKLGRLEEARSAVEAASAGALHATAADVDNGNGGHETAAEGKAQRGQTCADAAGHPPCLHCRALCVASELDLSEDQRENAKAKLQEVLEVDPGSADALSRLGRLLLGLDGGEEGKSVRRYGRKRRDDVEAARPLLERAVSEEPGCSSHAFWLARCYWEMGGQCREDRNFCFNALLKAAKLDPSNAKAFEWLGYWYQGVGGDRERARGCFLRSVKLDPSLRGAGEALALLYLENGQETLAVGLFRQCAAVSVACHWAWAGLGRSKIVEGTLAEAASHIQQAIRGSPTSWSYWSDLGWCYHAEGKQAAALKAYTRAEELLEDSLSEVAAPTEREGDDGSFPEEAEARRSELVARVRVRTQVGTIQRQIGQVDEAVASFSDALSLDPHSSLALAGAGEAFLAQAHARTSEGLYTAAAKALQNGCEVIRRFLTRGATGSSATGAAAPGGDTASGEGSGGGETGPMAGGDSAWKLLGDLHTYAHKLPPVCFEEEGGGGEEGHIARGVVVWGPGTKEAVLEQAALAKEGARNRLAFVAKGADAYRELVQLLEARVEHLRNKNETEASTEQQKAAVALKAAAHYDLGLNYLLRARLVCADAGEGSGLFGQSMYDDLPAVADLSKLADQAFRSAIGSEAGYSDAWNGLGAVSRDPLTQQHCWVRAVQLEHNPSAWANLGMLYVRWGLDIQAYESFGGLQAVTDHPTMWVGLGLLKEKEACQAGVTKAKRRRLLSQASDAYYSSLETGQHVDGLLGLGTTAGQTHSQADALVALQQHLDLSPHNAQAWNHLGAAAELAGRGTQAVAAYRRALGLLQEQSEKLKSAAATIEAGEVEEAILLTRGNLGRALVLTGEAKEAASHLEDTDVSQVDNKLQLGRARALIGEWDAAVEALEQVSVGVDGLISGAAVRYLRGDESGAIAAAGALVASHPDNRRVLHTVVSLAALAGDAALAQQASRLLQGLPKRPTAADSDGRLSRQHVAEEDLWAVHLAMRATGAPDVMSRRALSKAVHLSPSSISSWARLGAAAADSAAAVVTTTTTTTGGDDGGAEVSSKLAEDCLLAAEKLAMFSLLGRARDAGAAGGGGAMGGGGDGDNGRVSAVAKDLATSLSGIAKATMCGGGRGVEKSGSKGEGSCARVGEKSSSRRAVRQSCRAVHLYPAKTSAWRCLATALVSDSLSSASESRSARDAMLSDAHVLYRGISAVDSGPIGAKGDANNGMCEAEVQYTQMLLGHRGAGQAEIQSSGSSFVESLMAARAAVLRGGDDADADDDADAGREDAIERYKRALKIHPSSLVGWRELAVLYELCGRYHASAAALNCGVQTARPATSDGASHTRGGSSGSKQRRGSARAAPLYLQMAAATLSMPPGNDDVGLAHVGNAFRVGKGGAAGHALRGLMNARLGKGSLAAGALARAREAGLHPTIAAAVAERLAAIQALPEEASPALPVVVES